MFAAAILAGVLAVRSSEPVVSSSANRASPDLSQWQGCKRKFENKNGKYRDGAAFVRSLYAAKSSEHATTCTSIQRVGGNGDGGKLVCTDNIRPNDCVVYSLGSKLQFAFEIDVAKRFGCQVYTFDCTVGTPPASKIPAGVSFYPWCVGGKDETKPISSDLGHQGELGRYYTLATIQEKLGHSSVDLLKMDIERHEFAVVAALNGDNAPRQILFETHLHDAYGMWGAPVTESEWAAMWKTLSGLGFGVFAHEPNPWCVCCCEFSIVRGTPIVEHDVNHTATLRLMAPEDRGNLKFKMQDQTGLNEAYAVKTLEHGECVMPTRPWLHMHDNKDHAPSWLQSTGLAVAPSACILIAARLCI